MIRTVPLSILVVVALAVPAAAGAATWSPAAAVPAAGAGAFEPAVAIGADASEVLVWVNDGGVQSAVRLAGEATFGPVQNIAQAPPPGGSVGRLEVAQVPGAETIALWSRGGPGLGADRIEWAARPPGGTFGPIHQVPTTGLPADHRTVELSAAGAANGDVVLAWSGEGTEANGRHGFRIYGAVRTSDGDFGDPAPLSALGGLSPDVAAGPDGGAVAAWLEGGGTLGGAVRESRRPPGASFGAARTLERKPDAGLAQPFVAAGAGGETVAIWYRRDGATKRLRFAVRKATSDTFGPIGVLGQAPTRRYALGGGLGGDVGAVWDDRDGDGPVLRVRRRVPGHGFGTTVKLTHASGGTRAIRAAITDDGTLLTAWQRMLGPDADDLWAAGQARTGRRTELVRLQSSASSFLGFTLAAGAGQHGVAAWTAGAPGLLVSARG
jgi:hypothetical protein